LPEQLAIVGDLIQRTVPAFEYCQLDALWVDITQV